MLALWVTNRERLRRFVDQELLPKWGLEQVATWFWLKVTNTGQLVSPLVRRSENNWYPRPSATHCVNTFSRIVTRSLQGPIVAVACCCSQSLQCRSASDKSIMFESALKILFFAIIRASGYTNKQGCAMQEVAHRRPYEALLLARPRCSDSSESLEMQRRAVPDMVFFAVPGEHSRKPHLGRLLARHLPAQPACLEVPSPLC